MQSRVGVEGDVKAIAVGVFDRADGALTGIGWPASTGNDVGNLAAHAGVPGDLYRLLHRFDGLDLFVARVAGVHRVVFGGDTAEVDDLPMGGHTLPRRLEARRVAERSGFKSLLQVVRHPVDLAGSGGALIEAHDGDAEVAVGDE